VSTKDIDIPYSPQDKPRHADNCPICSTKTIISYRVRLHSSSPLCALCAWKREATACSVSLPALAYHTLQDTDLLSRFISKSSGAILRRSTTGEPRARVGTLQMVSWHSIDSTHPPLSLLGVCAGQQRILKKAIKRARHFGASGPVLL
jgi:ribosomal protein S18